MPSLQVLERPFWGGHEALSIRTQREGASECGGVDVQVGLTKHTYFILPGISPTQECTKIMIPWEELGLLKAVVKKMYPQLNFQGLSHHSRVVKNRGAKPMGDYLLLSMPLLLVFLLSHLFL